MTNPLTMRMEQFTRFEQEDRQRLNELISYPTKAFARGDVIIRMGDKVRNIHLVLTGLAARSKTLANGNVQLMAFLIPGDLCDVEVFVLEAMDHDIIAMTDTTCVLIPADEMERLLTDAGRITKAMWWSTMVDSAILREWIVGHGSRDSRERIAHLICEMLIRYRVVGETTDDAFPFPLTQEELAQATGMTPVYVNRMLQQLRSEGLIELNNKVLTVLEPKRLMEVGQYEPNYLHLVRTESGDREVAPRAGDLVPPSHQGIVKAAVNKVKSVLRKP
jgi:CRP-like cAMP-binding protein